MHLTCGCYLQQNEPVFSSVFPELEQLMEGYPVPKTKLRFYRSKEDYLLCTVMPMFKRPCRKYYRDQGPALKEMCSAGEIRVLELALIAHVKGDTSCTEDSK